MKEKNPEAAAATPHPVLPPAVGGEDRSIGWFRGTTIHTAVCGYRRLWHPSRASAA